MLDGKKILGVIPARGGSKGIPRKNIKMLGGKPLIAWTIEQAKKSKYIDRLIVSSEDKEIQKVAKEWGCEVPFERPAALALDESPGIDPVLHAISEIPGFDLVVLLQPTSPFRTAEDIDCALKMCVYSDCDTCVSVVNVESHPFWMVRVDNENRVSKFFTDSPTITRRQDLPKVFELNGSIYVGKTAFLIEHKRFMTENTQAYLMPKERSIDIDTALDFLVAETLLEQMKNV